MHLKGISEKGRLAFSRPNDVQVIDETTGKELYTSPNPGTYAHGVAFSPDSKWLAKACDDKTIRICDAATGKELRSLLGHTVRVVNLAFSADSKRLASTAYSHEGRDTTTGELKLWDFDSGKELHALVGHKFTIQSMRFSPHGRQLAGGDGAGTVYLWDTQSGERMSETLSAQGGSIGLPAMTFSLEGKQLFLGRSYGAQIEVLQADDGKVKSVHPAPYGTRGFCLSPDGKRLAAGGYFHELRIWDAETLQPILTAGDIHRCVAISPDGRWLALGGEAKEVTLWDIASGKVLRTLSHSKGQVSWLAFSPDGRRLAGAGFDEGHIWDVNESQPVFRWPKPSSTFSRVAFSRDGARLAIVSEQEARAKVYDAQTFESVCVGQSSQGRLSAIAFSPDGQYLAGACLEKPAVVLWNAATGKELHVFQAPPSYQHLNDVYFHPNGKQLVGSVAEQYGNACLAWDVESRQELWQVPKAAAGFSPDGKRLLVRSKPNLLAMLDSATQDERRRWELPGGVTAASFAPDGRHIITRNANGTVYVLRVDKAAAGATPPPEQPEPAIKPVTLPKRSAFDDLNRDNIPPHELAAAGDGDPAKAPKELVAIFGQSRLRDWRWIYCSQFAPDGKKLVTMGTDRRPRVWDATTGHALGSFLLPEGQLSPVSAGGRLAVSRPNEVQVVDLTTGKELFVSPNPGSVAHNTAFSFDGKWLAKACDDKTIRICDATTGKEVRDLKGHAFGVVNLAFSRDGKRLASTAFTINESNKAPGEVILWDFETGQELHKLSGHSFAIGLMTFSFDGRRLAGGDEPGTVYLWDAETGVKTSATPSAKGGGIGHPGLAFSPDNSRLLVGRHYGSQIEVIESASGNVLSVLPAPYGICDMVVSPDGKRLVAGGFDQDIRAWDAETLAPVLSPAENILAVAISPDGKHLALGGQSKHVKLVEIETGKVTRTWEHVSDRVSSLGFSADGQSLTAISSGGPIRTWSLVTGDLRHSWRAGQFGAGKLSLSRDATRLATICQNEASARLYDARTGDGICICQSPQGPWFDVAISPDGQFVAAASARTEFVTLFDETGKEIHSFQGFPGWNADSAYFHPDGKRLVGNFRTGGNCGLKFWDLQTRQELWSDSSLVVHGFSADGNSVLVGDMRGLLRILDLRTRDERRRWDLPGGVTSASFAPDSRHVITRNANGTVYVLRLAEAAAASARP